MKRFAVLLAVSVLFGALGAPAALAQQTQTDDTNVTLTAGDLSITTITVANFTGVTLSGSATSTAATMDAFSVTDATGSGTGWNVTVQATQFAQHDGTAYVTSGRTLPTSSLSMPQLTVAANGTDSPLPTITAGPYTLDAGAAVKVASAAADAGMGTYDFTQGGQLSLSIPADAYAATYRSDVTIDLVSGP